MSAKVTDIKTQSPVRQSVLPGEMTGLMYVCGSRGVGKSFFASSADRPDNICFVDMEQKGEGINSQLKFGKYLAPTALAAEKYGADFKPVQMYELLKQQFASIEKDRYTVAVIDNIKPLEEALVAEVKKFPIQYGVNPQNAQTGAFGGPWVGVNNLVTGYCNLLFSKGIKLIIVTAHLKAAWGAQGPIPNKFRPVGVERWQELSILSLVLVPGDNPPTPSALIQKEQLGRAAWNDDLGELEIQRRLPLRLPQATFAEIRRYLREPADLRSPKPGEVPTQEEALPFSEKFSKDQLQFLIASAQAAASGELVNPEDDVTPKGEAK